MARALRIEFAGAVYHVASRGNARQDIVRDDLDRHKWVDWLRRTVETYRWRLHAWVLMRNHDHLFVETPEPNLSAGMQYFNGSYTSYFNRRHRCCGHLFQGRYKGHLIDEQGCFLEVSRYLHLNPVRAKIASRPEEYPWSSYRGYQRTSRAVPWGWPPKPVDAENLVSWDIPGMSPSDAAACYNGMFGVFKGLNIKGVLFHQGYNNAISSNCRPQRYRVFMKLMVEGWREDFNEPNLPVIVIGFCAGGDTQDEDNFEELSHAGGPYIREAQRLGPADVGDPQHTAFLPAYDVKVPGLHPGKKAEPGLRAARWALNRVYGLPMFWETASLVSAEPQGDEMILTFDWSVRPDDYESIPRGFSIAGEDGKFYMAHARYRAKKDQPNWRDARSHENMVIHVWSPLVEKPVAVRYGWATSPMGNLKVNGHPACPLPSFRTDDWDWPESEDLEVDAVGSAESKDMEREAIDRCEYRRTEEARRAVEIFQRIKTRGRSQ